MPKLVMSSETQTQHGFTLVELLVVVAITSLISLIGVTSFKDFSDKQPGIKTQREIQSLLRLAQSNASTSTNCNTDKATSWAVRFESNTKMILHCEPGNIEFKTFNLQNTQIEKISCGSSTAILPVAFNYSVSSNALSFSSVNNDCVNASSWTITVRNLKDNTIKELIISKGGTINVL